MTEVTQAERDWTLDDSDEPYFDLSVDGDTQSGLTLTQHCVLAGPKGGDWEYAIIIAQFGFANQWDDAALDALRDKVANALNNPLPEQGK